MYTRTYSVRIYRSKRVRAAGTPLWCLRILRASLDHLQEHRQPIRKKTLFCISTKGNERSPPRPPCQFACGFESAACWRRSRRGRPSPRPRPARFGPSWSAPCCSSPAPPGGQGGNHSAGSFSEARSFFGINKPFPVGYVTSGPCSVSTEGKHLCADPVQQLCEGLPQQDLFVTLWHGPTVWIDTSSKTHSVLRLSLVALHFALKLLDELLHPQQSLLLLLRLAAGEPVWETHRTLRAHQNPSEPIKEPIRPGRSAPSPSSRSGGLPSGTPRSFSAPPPAPSAAPSPEHSSSVQVRPDQPHDYYCHCWICLLLFIVLS